MSTTDRPALLPATPLSPRDVPVPLYVGLVLGALGFFVHLETLTTSNIGGVQTCSYQDFAALVVAFVCVLCAGLGIAARRARPYRYRVHPAVVYALAAVLVLLAVVHVLRGLGVLSGPC